MAGLRLRLAGLARRLREALPRRWASEVMGPAEASVGPGTRPPAARSALAAAWADMGPRPAPRADYGTGWHVVVTGCGWIAGALLGSLPGGWFALLAGLAGATAGWCATPWVCAKLGIAPSSERADGPRHGGTAVTGFVLALGGLLLLPGLALPAVILGHIAHVKAGYEDHKKGLAMAAWIIGYATLAIEALRRAG